MNKKMERKSRLALTLLLAGVTFAVELLFLLLLAAVVLTLSGTDVFRFQPSLPAQGVPQTSKPPP